MPLSIKDLHEFGSRQAGAVAQERPKANCGLTVTGGNIPHPAIGAESRSRKETVILAWRIAVLMDKPGLG